MNQVQTVTVSTSVPKEGKEVIDFAFAIISGDLRAGKSFAEISARFGQAIEAVSGWDKIDDELKSEHLADLVGYTTSIVVKTLKPNTVAGA